MKIRTVKEWRELLKTEPQSYWDLWVKDILRDLEKAERERDVAKQLIEDMRFLRIARGPSTIL